MNAPLLVVNADDFGFTHDVNAGILAAHREGILTATTLMANGPAFENAAALARDTPSLDVGCHLMLVQGPGLPASIRDLLIALARRSIDLRGELRRQVAKILAAGVRLSHLDTHKHTHLAPPVLDAVIDIAREFNIRWIRKPTDFPLRANSAPWMKRAVHTSVSLLASRFESRLRAAGCRTTDYFTGFQFTGRLDTPRLATLIRELPAGITELMSHPGFFTAELASAPTRLKQSRLVEYQALVSPEARRALSERGARLVSFRDL